MVEPLQQSDGQLKHPDVQFERSDASFRGIAIIIAVVIVVGVAIHLIVMHFLLNNSARDAQAKRSPYSLAPGAAHGLPREPRLEQIDRLEGASNIYERETRNLATLNSYGSTADDGYVRVPIERAMQALIDSKSLKSRSKLPPPDAQRRAGGLLDAGAPNAGRVFKETSK
jgi:hypothetical protein